MNLKRNRKQFVAKDYTYHKKQFPIAEIIKIIIAMTALIINYFKK
jgi:hypothetical protein